MSDYVPMQPEGKFDRVTGLWLLTQPWWIRLPDGRRMVVEPGILSDGASIPWLLQPIIGPRFHNRTMPAAFGHDCGYASEILPRADLDEALRVWLIQCGCWRATAATWKAGVAIGGGRVWKTHTPESVAEARKFVKVVGSVDPTEPNGALLESA